MQTNLVERPSAEVRLHRIHATTCLPKSQAAEISPAEFIAAVPSFLAKVRTRRPRIVCIVGKVVWVAVEKVLRQSTSLAQGKGAERRAGVVEKGKVETLAARTEWGMMPWKVTHSVRVLVWWNTRSLTDGHR